MHGGEACSAELLAMPGFVYRAESQNFPAQGAALATCPQPLPAPGVGSGLLLPLDEKTDVCNPDVSRCICSLGARAVPRAGGESRGCAGGLQAGLWAAVAPGVFVLRRSGLCPAGPGVQGRVASALSSSGAADEPSARMKLEASVRGRNSFDVAAREFRAVPWII